MAKLRYRGTFIDCPELGVVRILHDHACSEQPSQLGSYPLSSKANYQRSTKKDSYLHLVPHRLMRHMRKASKRYCYRKDPSFSQLSSTFTCTHPSSCTRVPACISRSCNGSINMLIVPKSASMRIHLLLDVSTQAWLRIFSNWGLGPSCSLVLSLRHQSPCLARLLLLRLQLPLPRLI